MKKILTLITISMVFVATNAGAFSYAFYRLSTLGGNSSVANGINDNGQIVGQSKTASNQSHAFIWDNGEMTDIGTFGGVNSNAYAINNLGQVVGYAQDAANNCVGFVYDDTVGTKTGILNYGGSNNTALDINDSGQVVGYVEMPVTRSSHAFLWEDDTLTDLGVIGGDSSALSSTAQGINEDGDIVGISRVAVDSHAFLWDSDTQVMEDLGTISGTSSGAYDINNTGQIVGRTNISDTYSLWHPFLYDEDNESMTDLGSFGGYGNVANAINDDGLVVGQTCSTNRPPVDYTGFLYADGVMYDLNDFVDYFELFTIVNATDINKYGDIVGYGKTLEGEFRAYVLYNMDAVRTPEETIPEPMTIILSAFGVISLLIKKRK